MTSMPLWNWPSSSAKWALCCGQHLPSTGRGLESRKNAPGFSCRYQAKSSPPMTGLVMISVSSG